MKKKFLDELYDLRSRIIADIERLTKNSKDPRSHCDKCNSHCDENMAELRTRKSQLSSLDDIITSYIKYHSV